jgi:hypothetical protein
MRARASAAGVTAQQARRLRERPAHVREGRRLCGRRATERSEWRGGRAGLSTSTGLLGGRLRAWRVAGSDDLARAQRTERSATQWSAASCASSGPVRQAGPSVAYPRRTSGPAIPGHGKGRLRAHRRRSRPCRIARGMDARQGRDAQRLDAKHDSPAPRRGGHARASGHLLIAACLSQDATRAPRSTRDAPTCFHRVAAAAPPASDRLERAHARRRGRPGRGRCCAVRTTLAHQRAQSLTMLAALLVVREPRVIEQFAPSKLSPRPWRWAASRALQPSRVSRRRPRARR